MTIQSLISFIDRHTANGTAYTCETWGERAEIEEGIVLLQSLNSNEWLALYEQLTKRSHYWLECLIELLDEFGTQEARQMIIHLAVNGTEETFFDAMECIHDFRRDVSTYTWLKLKNRSAETQKSRLNQ